MCKIDTECPSMKRVVQFLKLRNGTCTMMTKEYANVHSINQE